MAKSTLAGLFGRSPFKPMQEHMQIVTNCAAEVIPLIDALVAGDQSGVEGSKQRIFELEQQADDAKNAIRANLPRSLLMPVDRRDLLEILHAQDSIADTAQDVAGLCVMRKTRVPESFTPLLQEYVRRVVDAVEQCRRVINELDELLEIGFRGRQVDQVEDMINELGRIETETDEQGMRLMACLFEIDEQLSTGAFFFWHQMIENVGDIADFAEDVGDRLRLLVAR